MSEPNSSNPVQITNEWGSTITDVVMSHRYDRDHYDSHTWASIDHGKTVGGMKVGYWTGAFRTGKDYWHITFSADGKRYSCKDNFYCFLTSDDANDKGIVNIALGNMKMVVKPPISRSDYVDIQQVG